MHALLRQDVATAQSIWSWDDASLAPADMCSAALEGPAQELVHFIIRWYTVGRLCWYINAGKHMQCRRLRAAMQGREQGGSGRRSCSSRRWRFPRRQSASTTSLGGLSGPARRTRTTPSASSSSTRRCGQLQKPMDRACHMTDRLTGLHPDPMCISPHDHCWWVVLHVCSCMSRGFRRSEACIMHSHGGGLCGKRGLCSLLRRSSRMLEACGAHPCMCAVQVQSRGRGWDILPDAQEGDGPLQALSAAHPV